MEIMSFFKKNDGNINEGNFFIDSLSCDVQHQQQKQQHQQQHEGVTHTHEYSIAAVVKPIPLNPQTSLEKQ